MIRQARPSDAIEILHLALEALSRDSYPELEIDKARVMQVVLQCVNSKRHFVWLSESGGKICGVLAALVAPHAFYKHNQAIILMWYCNKPGDGGRLMLKFMEWLEGQPTISHVERSSERGEDPKIGDFLAKIGFKERLTTHNMLRGCR